VFGSIRSRDVRSIAGPVFDIDTEQGTKLVVQGEPAGTFFVIRAGHAELWRGRSMLRTLGPGDCFGEIDPLAPRPQRFTVIASSPMRLLAFSAFGIARLCATIPGVRERILECLARSAGAAATRVQRRLVEDGDRAMVSGDPAELAHQSQSARDGLPRRAGPPRKLVLGQSQLDPGPA
jgi:CRP/FNR family transcriptional regulator, cyclic AMP receptor protein